MCLHVLCKNAKENNVATPHCPSVHNFAQVLLFPGGAREVNKRVGQEYQLFWKDSPDFVRLAARCGAIIVPFAAVGADDAYDVIMEAEDLLETPVLGNLIKVCLYAPMWSCSHCLMLILHFGPLKASSGAY